MWVTTLGRNEEPVICLIMWVMKNQLSILSCELWRTSYLSYHVNYHPRPHLTPSTSSRSESCRYSSHQNTELWRCCFSIHWAFVIWFPSLFFSFLFFSFQSLLDLTRKTVDKRNCRIYGNSSHAWYLHFAAKKPRLRTWISIIINWRGVTNMQGGAVIVRTCTSGLVIVRTCMSGFISSARSCGIWMRWWLLNESFQAVTIDLVSTGTQHLR